MKPKNYRGSKNCGCVALESYENPNKLTCMTTLFAAESKECFDGGSTVTLAALIRKCCCDRRAQQMQFEITLPLLFENPVHA